MGAGGDPQFGADMDLGPVSNYVYVILSCEKKGDKFVYTVGEIHRDNALDVIKLNKQIDTAEKEQDDAKAKILKRRLDDLRGTLPLGTFESKEIIKSDTIIHSNQIGPLGIEFQSSREQIKKKLTH
jgi:hypothetical protein